MTTQSPNSHSDIINLLWNLKQRINRSTHHTAVEFAPLLNNPGYRQKTLDEARQSHDEHIRRMAQQLAQTPLPDSLLSAGRPLTAPLRTPQPVLARRWRRLGLAGLAFAALGLAAVNWTPLVIERVTGVVSVNGDIGRDTTWHAERTYRLATDIFVHNGARLTIEPGTLILGERGSSLIVAQGSQLIARGRLDRPIVFTSAQPIGMRQRGDWGGLVLLGQDRTNEAFTRVEGVDSRDIRGQFGGQLENGSCGELRFVRIEYAGYEAFPGNELNGLTLGGCGPQTEIDYVQVHKALDDGIEMFGGSANLRHIVITGARDDSLDWDLGWDGKVQFLIVQQHTGTGDRAFEGDNSPERDQARPRSAPAMSNITLIGGDDRHTAMVLRSGTAGRFQNVLLAGYGANPIDLRGELTADRTASGELDFNNVTLDTRLTPLELWAGEVSDNDAGFNEHSFFAPITNMSRDLLAVGAWDPNHPDFRPVESAAGADTATFPDDSDFWDTRAKYPGAVAPQEEAPWYLGWTDFSDR